MPARDDQHPRPRQTVYLAGAALRGAPVWAPCPGGLQLDMLAAHAAAG